jgi:transposase
MWLIGNLRPDFKTIANFRHDNKSKIKSAFQAFSVICDQLGMIGKEIVAVDGSKFRACNSREAYYSKKKIDEKLAHYNKSAAEYLKLLDACDGSEPDNPKFTKDELIQKLDKINTRVAELTVIREDVLENGNICETDTDSRMMKTANSGADICHNIQIAVDNKSHIVVAVDVTSQAIDKEQLYNMSAQAKANMEVQTLTVVADKGYYSASQFKECSESGIVPIVPKNIYGRVPSDEFEKTAFTYDDEKGGYICPMGVLLSPFKATSKTSNYVKYANSSACKQCQERSKCTSGKYRTVQDNALHKYSAEVDKRVKDNPKAYLLRKQLAEHPFGTIKRALGFTYFLTIGTESVRSEALLHFLIYNMKRAINQMGTTKLIEALRG